MAGLMKRLFRGTESAAEEKAEARAVRSGKITPKQYVAGEKSEGETEPGMMARAKALKSGKMSPAAYAKHESKEKAMKCGGKVKKMAVGGLSVRPGTAIGMGKPAPTPAVRSALEAAVGRGGGKPSPVKPSFNPAATGGGKPSPVKPQFNPAATGGGKPARPMAKGGGVEAKGKTAGKAVKMAKGGGVELKGKTKAKMV